MQGPSTRASQKKRHGQSSYEIVNIVIHQGNAGQNRTGYAVLPSSDLKKMKSLVISSAEDTDPQYLLYITGGNVSW